MKYTPAELDRMRSAIWSIISIHDIGTRHSDSERTARVERELLTYMMNETTPQELFAHSVELWRKRNKGRRELERLMERSSP